MEPDTQEARTIRKPTAQESTRPRRYILSVSWLRTR